MLLKRDLKSEINSVASKEAKVLRGQADGKAAKIYGKSYGRNAEFYQFYETLNSYKKQWVIIQN